MIRGSFHGMPSSALSQFFEQGFASSVCGRIASPVRKPAWDTHWVWSSFELTACGEQKPSSAAASEFQSAPWAKVRCILVSTHFVGYDAPWISLIIWNSATFVDLRKLPFGCWFGCWLLSTLATARHFTQCPTAHESNLWFLVSGQRQKILWTLTGLAPSGLPKQEILLRANRMLGNYIRRYQLSQYPHPDSRITVWNPAVNARIVPHSTHTHTSALLIMEFLDSRHRIIYSRPSAYRLPRCCSATDRHISFIPYLYQFRTISCSFSICISQLCPCILLICCADGKFRYGAQRFWQPVCLVFRADATGWSSRHGTNVGSKCLGNFWDLRFPRKINKILYFEWSPASRIILI